MPEFSDERELVRAVRRRLDEWLYDARERAFNDLFEGPDAVLTEAELRRLDRLDSALSRREGEGLWNRDEYGIVPTGTMDEESAPHVVCTVHPQIPEYGVPGGEPIDEATRKKLNEALWDYAERVTELVQQEIEEFVWSADVDTWTE